MSAPHHQHEPGLPPAVVIAAIAILTLLITAMAYAVITLH